MQRGKWVELTTREGNGRFEITPEMKLAGPKTPRKRLSDRVFVNDFATTYRARKSMFRRAAEKVEHDLDEDRPRVTRQCLKIIVERVEQAGGYDLED